MAKFSTCFAPYRDIFGWCERVLSQTIRSSITCIPNRQSTRFFTKRSASSLEKEMGANCHDEVRWIQLRSAESCL